MTFEEDFPSLKGKVIYSQAYEDGSLEHPDTLIKEVVAENCLDKHKVKEAIQKWTDKGGFSHGYLNAEYLLKELGLD